MKRTVIFAGVTALMVALWQGRYTAADDGRSAAVARQLASLMADRQLDALAAKDPASPERFVAALLFPGVQLLVVSAHYSSAAELEGQLAQSRYRDVYSALQQPVTMPSRVFFLDLGCDGLRSGQDGVDVMYERGTTQTLFDGNWRKQGLSERAYTQKLVESDERYARLLTVLIDSVKTPPAGSHDRR